ncbi:MAG: LuxR C-terminal-related transcriptional regulator, partial [Gammaproteobacteria bacterium]|nr:LuxR C-terminal-related transcriptional regulator [Gammaproteobacteria bacterium]
LLVDGLSNRQIADKINLSEDTVRQYVTIILRNLGVDNRTKAANAGKNCCCLHRTGVIRHSVY